MLSLNSRALDSNREGLSKAQNTNKEEGAYYKEPCLGCLKSILASKSNSNYFKNIKNNKIITRYYKYISSYTYLLILCFVLLIAKEYLVLISYK
jgi:hypothetical protein